MTPPPPTHTHLENREVLGFLSKTGPEKTQATHHCWAIIGPPAKRHFDCQLLVVQYLSPLSPHQLR